MLRRPVLTRVGVGLALLVVAGFLMGPAFAAPAPETDEGLLVAYPAQVLQGRLPHRDFLSFYGPGEPWLVAGADKILGTSLHTERVVGMGFRLLLIGAAYLLALPWGILIAAASAAIAAMALVTVVAANAIVGVEALGLLGLALLVRAMLTTEPSRRRDRLLFGAGAVLGLSVLWRYDFAPAAIISALPMWLLYSRRERRHFAVGFAAGLVPYLVQIVLVGPANEWRADHIAVFSESGRRLGLPPFHSTTFDLLALYGLSLAAFFGTGIWSEWRDRRNPEGRALLSIGLYSAALLPFAASLLEPAHVLFASLPVLCMLPVALTVLARLDPPRRPTPRWRAVAAAATALALALLAAPQVLRDGLFTEIRYTFDGTHLASFTVTGEQGRTWLLADPLAAHDVQSMITAIDRLARPGQSLFVGTSDLRGANENDVELYFLLPELRPASYYMELEQNAFNARNSGLAGELRRADWLILTSRFPTARLGGSSEPNEVVASKFCVRAESGTYKLLERCALQLSRG